MQFQSIQERNQVALMPEEDRPEVKTFHGRQVEDAPEEIVTEWGTAIAMPGDYVLKHPDHDGEFVVSKTDAESGHVWAEV